MDKEPTLFELVGGQRVLTRLANEFYDRIERDDFLRPMFPAALGCARRQMGTFLCEFLGGPSTYSPVRGSPLLVTRHAKFRIGPAQRDRWLALMGEAIDSVGIRDPARQQMREFFAEASAYLVNTPPGAGTGQQAAQSGGNCGWQEAWMRLTAVDQAIACAQSGDNEGLSRALGPGGGIIDKAARRDVLSYALRSRSAAVRATAVRFLAAERDLVNVAGELGTLLHEASADWNEELVHTFIRLGADVNWTAGGHPALYYAANRTVHPCESEANGVNVVRLLLEHGADPNAKSGPKQTTALHMASRRGTSGIAGALIDAGADLEAKDSNGQTPLRRAVNCGSVEVAALLIARGADVDAVGKDGKTSRDVARTEEMRGVVGLAGRE